MHRPYLSRPEAAEYICARGLIVSKNTLQKYATVGGGPVYRRFGNRAVYTTSDLDAWIEQKLSDPIRSTSETPPLASGDRAYIPVMPPWWRDDT
jgi:hypothetical protein